VKKLFPWLAVIVVMASVWIGVDHWKPAANTLQRAVSPGPLSAAHASLANKCESCHETNVGVTVAKCTACHANSERLLGREPTAFHANIGECSSCHLEHRGANVRPVLMDHVALAKIGAHTLMRASRTDDASAATVQSLKTWLHVSNLNDFDEHSADAALNCIGCHSTKDRHLGLFGKNCAQCHSTTKWSVAGYQHPSPSSTTCAQCHQAPPSHYMMHFDMIDKSIAGQEDSKVAGCCGKVEVRQCYRCHQTTVWNDIRGVGYYKHH
jgi:hypothetical protein